METNGNPNEGNFDLAKVQLKTLVYSVRISVYLEHLIRIQHPDKFKEVFQILEQMITENTKDIVADIVKEK